MDYKEKLEKAKELYPTANADQRYVLECLFPELAESEDERVRKELIFYLRYQHSISENFEDIGKWLAWLEKQGEQKPTDKDMIEALRTEYEKGRADVIADTLSWLENCWPKYCSNQTIIGGYKEAIKYD